MIISFLYLSTEWEYGEIGHAVIRERIRVDPIRLYKDIIIKGKLTSVNLERFLDYKQTKVG